MKSLLQTKAILAVFLSMVLCLPSLAQQEPPESFVVEDLQLISLASLSDWESSWEYSRAVESATVLAWFHDRGYVLLLDDLNEDGIIDEQDTIELADRLGKHSMGCEKERQGTDAWLLVGLAEYVADKYPDVFELKIYDRGFPNEYERKTGKAFSPEAIPGIILSLETEPSFSAYMKELVEEEGVILGLEEEEGRNLYFTGRSFLRDPIAANTYGIDLAWAEEDWYKPGSQGKILETRALQTDALYVDYQGQLMKVESMFALSPLYPPGEGPAEGEACPDLIVGGSAVCECSESCMITVDATVYNIGSGEVTDPFVVSLTEIACGVHAECPYTVTLSGAKLDHLNATGSVHVTFPAFGIPVPTWPCPTCTATLVVDSKGDIDEGCYQAPRGEYNNTSPVSVCCEEKVPDCPDLAVTGTAQCICEPAPTGTPAGTLCTVEIKANITNISHPLPVDSPFNVYMAYGCIGGAMGTTTKPVGGAKLSQLNTTGSTTLDFSYQFAPDLSDPCCKFGLFVDLGNVIDESCHLPPGGEHNNVFVGTICCKIPTQSRCPDLTIEDSALCVCGDYYPDGSPTGSDLATAVATPACTITVTGNVANIGTAPIGSDFIVALKYTCSDGSGNAVETTITPTEINPTNSATVTFTFPFSPLGPEENCCSYAMTVDETNVIPECKPDGEANNSASGVVCCEVPEGCPDIAVEITRESCRCQDEPVYERECIRWEPNVYPPRCVAWDEVIVDYETNCDVDVSYTVKNIGAQDAGPFTVRMESSTGAESITYISGGLVAGEEKYRTFSFSLEDGGTVTITIFADCYDDVPAECNEDNNTAETTVTCR